MRWHHPTRGVVAPIEFIPIAEATGLIVPLGRQVLRDATRQAQAWRQSGLVDEQFYVSVNLSARQLQDPELLGDVSRALSDSGLPPDALVLEVTESTLIENLDVTLPRLHALKSLGLRLAVDDFGTGYSSLSYLADLPVSFVKIDKSFIDRITRDAEGAAMVRGVIDLSRALGLTCICRGRRARQPARRARRARLRQRPGISLRPTDLRTRCRTGIHPTRKRRSRSAGGINDLGLTPVKGHSDRRFAIQARSHLST